MEQDIGDRINQARLAAGDTPQGLAKALGISLTSFYNWTSGAVENIKLPHTLAICKRYNLEFEWLVTGNGPMYWRENPLDLETLTTCIDALETDLLESNQTHTPKEKAEVVAYLYALWKDNGLKPEKAKIVDFLKFRR